MLQCTKAFGCTQWPNTSQYCQIILESLVVSQIKILVPRNTKKRLGMGAYRTICMFSLFIATN